MTQYPIHSPTVRIEYAQMNTYIHGNIERRDICMTAEIIARGKARVPGRQFRARYDCCALRER